MCVLESRAPNSPCPTALAIPCPRRKGVSNTLAWGVLAGAVVSGQPHGAGFSLPCLMTRVALGEEKSKEYG